MTHQTLSRFPAPAAVRDGRPLVLGGLFSGIGGFELAWRRQGGRIAWMCEIDPDARRVLARRFPGVPIYEDVRDIDPASVEPVDVLTGGSPCTSFSAAGLRTGLGGESGLVLEMLRIIDGLSGRGLSDVLWENVPNVFSVVNEDGSAVWPQLVAAFLHGMAVTGDLADEVDVQFPADRPGSWTAGVAAVPGRALAWRVLNSRFVGAQVPQGRCRVYAHLALREDSAGRAVRGLLEGTDSAAGTHDANGRWLSPFGEQMDLFADQRVCSVALLGDGVPGGLAHVSEGRCSAGPVADGSFCPGGRDEHPHLDITDLHDRDAPARYRIAARGRLGRLLRALRRGVPLDPMLAEALSHGLAEALGEDVFRDLVDNAASGAEAPVLSAESLAALAAVPDPDGPVVRTVHYRLRAFGHYVASDFGATLLARDWKDATDIVVEAIGGGGDTPTVSVALPTGGEDPTLFGDPLPADLSEVGESPAPVAYRCRRLTPLETAAMQGFPDVVTVDTADLDVRLLVDVALWTGLVRVVAGEVYRVRDDFGFPLPQPDRLTGKVSFEPVGVTIKVDAAAFLDPDGHDLEIDGSGVWDIVPPAWSVIPDGMPRAGWEEDMGSAGARFRATGNAVSANVVEWAFARILHASSTPSRRHGMDDHKT